MEEIDSCERVSQKNNASPRRKQYASCGETKTLHNSRTNDTIAPLPSLPALTALSFSSSTPSVPSLLLRPFASPDFVRDHGCRTRSLDRNKEIAFDVMLIPSSACFSISLL